MKKSASPSKPKSPSPIQHIDLDLIRTYWRNPRVCEEAVPFVVESIKRFGFNVPIVVDMKNVIIAGHTRYRAARQLGMKTIPVLQVDLSEDRAKQFRIADNKTSELAKWDDATLKEELEKITELDEVRQLFGGPNWDAILNMSALPQYGHDGSLNEYATNGEVQDQFEVSCPHCGKENIIKLTEIGKE